MSIFLRGDTHGDNVRAFSYKEYPILRDVQEGDTLIVLGDTAIGWPGFDPTTEYVLKSIDEKVRDKGFNVVWLFGNHDNYDYAMDLSTVDSGEFAGMRQVEFNGVKYERQYICDKPVIADIDGKHCLFIPGADSHDIDFLFFPSQTKDAAKLPRIPVTYRTIGVSWWPEETVDLSYLSFLMADHWDEYFDYVFTHDCTGKYVIEKNDTFGLHLFKTKSEKFFDAMSDALYFGYWYHGHMHDDFIYGDNNEFTCLYEQWVDAAIGLNITEE